MPVYKDKNTRKWYFSTYYTDGYGERKRKVKRGYKTKGEAVSGERDFHYNIDRVASGKVTLREVFEHKLKHTTLSNNTMLSYNNSFKNHIEPYFNDKLISDITMTDVSDFRTRLIKNTRTTSTASNVFIAFRVIYNHAVNHFDVNSDLLKRVKSIKRDKKQINPIQKHEFDKKVQEFENIDHRDYCILLFNTGLRAGEGLALQWKHVNLDDNMISVVQAVNTITSKIEQKPKTQKSVGVVPIPRHLSALLKGKKEQQYNVYEDFDESFFLFAGKKRMDYKSFRKQYNRIFPDNTVHDLRHSYASYLANKGVDMFVLKDLLRHENISTTVNTYSHIYDETRISAVSLLDN